MGGFGDISCPDFCRPFKLLFSHGSNRSNMVRLNAFCNLTQGPFAAVMFTKDGETSFKKP